jgi:hypothetical protein
MSLDAAGLSWRFSKVGELLLHPRPVVPSRHLEFRSGTCCWLRQNNSGHLGKGIPTEAD